jgi:hypothetical protein
MHSRVYFRFEDGVFGQPPSTTTEDGVMKLAVSPASTEQGRYIHLSSG